MAHRFYIVELLEKSFSKLAEFHDDLYVNKFWNMFLWYNLRNMNAKTQISF